MNSRCFVLLLAAAGLLGMPGTLGVEDSTTLDPLELQTLTTLGHLVISCDAYRLDHERYPGGTEGFVTADFLGPYVSPVYIRELPTRDAWGSPFQYASDGQRMAILSYGPDGLPDREYLTPETLEPTEDAGDDLVWRDGRLVICPARICRLERQGGQKRTMADLRSAGTAVEAYAVDHGAYPGPTAGYVPLATIRGALEPVYIRALPVADAWGNTLLYHSDGQHYRIVSPGWDGAADRPYDEVLPGTRTQSFASDIVFGDGRFLQWPEGEQR